MSPNEASSLRENGKFCLSGENQEGKQKQSKSEMPSVKNREPQQTLLNKQATNLRTAHSAKNVFFVFHISFFYVICFILLLSYYYLYSLFLICVFVFPCVCFYSSSPFCYFAICFFSVLCSFKKILLVCQNIFLLYFVTSKGFNSWKSLSWITWPPTPWLDWFTRCLRHTRCQWRLET